ncbi:flagellin [Albimonas pacifica]|uniref:Flagellin n=1 Tax=Albimonas pacifica TaxID=1114924 RepID=A0A1I3II14_9RHOB|nr:flagellin [Albimonas pacifica]SFI47628.1 flagellin [Albimonas pacifica]
MASILTNTSAMVALQTLNGTNKNLNQIQQQISTGKKVGSAKDNAAVWAISSVMQSDVKGFKGISESLSLGASTVEVGRQAAETVTELLTDIKGKIVASQEENVDRAKIQTDIDALRSQITSVLGAAQFNGKNLVDSYDETSVLSSLDRAGNGSVSSSSISFRGQNLTSEAGTVETASAIDRIGTVADDGTYTVGAGATLSNAANDATITIANDMADGDTLTIDFADQQFTFTNNTGANITVADLDDIVAAGLANLGVEGVTTAVSGAGEVTISSTNSFESITMQGSSTGATTFVVDPDAGGAQAAGAAGAAGTLTARAETVSLGGAGNTGGVVNEGDGFRISLGGQNFDYTAKEGDTLNDVATGLKRVIDAGGIDGISVQVNLSDDPISQPPTLQIDNDAAATVALTVDDGSGGVASGGLVGLDGIDVSTADGAANALANIESLIQTSIDAAAEFGSVQGRIDIQADFVKSLTDSLTSGIGALVDANLEEASARLQALQVQQQLGIQALSIANQAPQSVLSLFR